MFFPFMRMRVKIVEWLTILYTYDKICTYKGTMSDCKTAGQNSL